MFPLSQLRYKLTQALPAILLLLLLSGSLGGLIWLTFFTDTFTVQSITVVDARPHTEQQVRTIASDSLGKNMLFLPTMLLEQKVLSEFPHVRTVHIERTLPGTLKIIVQEKNPKLLMLSGGKYYFVDEDGQAYEEASLETLPGVVLPTIKNSDASAQVSVGTQVVEALFIRFLDELEKGLPEIVSAHVVEIRIPSLSAREVSFFLSNNWEIRFDSTRAASGQLSILKQLVTSTISPEEQQVLQYIDLRIPNRVYYKTTTAIAPSVKQ